MRPNQGSKRPINVPLIAGALALAAALALGIWKSSAPKDSNAGEGGAEHGSSLPPPSAGSQGDGLVVRGSNGSGTQSGGPVIQGSNRPGSEERPSAQANGAGASQATMNPGVVKGDPATGTSSGQQVPSFSTNGIRRPEPPADLPAVEDLLKPTEGLDLTTELPPAPQTAEDRSLAHVERMATQNPEAAAAWVEASTVPEIREEAIEFVYQQWVLKDPAKADAWKVRAMAALKEGE